MTTTGRRPRAVGARREAAPSREPTVTIAMQVPEEPWHRFQIALVLDKKKMQEWVNDQVQALVHTPWNQLPDKPEPYQRVPRGKGPTRQVIARIPKRLLPALQLRLAKKAIPMSWWLYTEILAYTKDLNQRLAKAKAVVDPKL